MWATFINLIYATTITTIIYLYPQIDLFLYDSVQLYEQNRILFKNQIYCYHAISYIINIFVRRQISIYRNTSSSPNITINKYYVVKKRMRPHITNITRCCVI